MDTSYINYYEIITAYFIGLMLLMVACALLKLKPKTACRLAINSLCGTAFYFILAIFSLFTLPLNAVNIFMCGITGISGALLITILNIFI